jgi:hypothetical protein
MEISSKELASLHMDLLKAEARAKKAEKDLASTLALAKMLYEHVQGGAGCCGEDIGYGSRIDQIIQHILYLTGPGPHDKYYEL